MKGEREIVEELMEAENIGSKFWINGGSHRSCIDGWGSDSKTFFQPTLLKEEYRVKRYQPLNNIKLNKSDVFIRCSNNSNVSTSAHQITRCNSKITLIKQRGSIRFSTTKKSANILDTNISEKRQTLDIPSLNSQMTSQNFSFGASLAAKIRFTNKEANLIQSSNKKIAISKDYSLRTQDLKEIKLPYLPNKFIEPRFCYQIKPMDINSQFESTNKPQKTETAKTFVDQLLGLYHRRLPDKSTTKKQSLKVHLQDIKPEYPSTGKDSAKNRLFDALKQMKKHQMMQYDEWISARFSKPLKKLATLDK